MSNIFGLLNIGGSALSVQQKAIDITGNNIANVNTPGYSRQRLTMTQGASVRVLNTTMSTGVDAEQRIQRFYDQFLSLQLNNENENLGRWEVQQEALKKAEALFDEASGYGLSSVMSDYWNAWQEVGNNPSGHVERTSLLSAGEQLSMTFNQLRDGLTQLQDDIDTHIDSVVGEINQIASQMADLNQKITQIEVKGHNANDFRDQRDLLVLNLSKLIDIDSFEDADGNLSVMVGGGRPLVEGPFAKNLSTGDNGGRQDIFWTDSSGGAINITSRIQGGELNGWIQSRDQVVEGYIDELDTLAGEIINQVNTLHGAGYTLNGTSGVPFFSGSSAMDIALNSVVASDADLVAAAGSAAGVPGDNSAAWAIAGLQDELTMSGASSTFDQFYSALIGVVGNDVRAAEFSYQHQESMVLGLETRRQEVSGVSLDEEMVNLVKFQHAYNAAAKLITTTDDMLDSLLSMVR